MKYTHLKVFYRQHDKPVIVAFFPSLKSALNNKGHGLIMTLREFKKDFDNYIGR